jgi:hypothetical protein
MKKILASLLVCLAVSFLYATRNANWDRVFDEMRGRKRPEWIERAHASADATAQAGCVVFIGDSLIQSLPVNRIASPALNLGIGGEPTGRLLIRARSYQSLRTARAVVVQSGINDLVRGASPESIVANLEALRAFVPAQVPVVVCELLPNRFADVAPVNKLIRERLGGSCRIVSGDCISEKKLSPITCEGDGLHLGPAAQVAWMNAIAGRIHGDEYLKLTGPKI